MNTKKKLLLITLFSIGFGINGFTQVLNLQTLIEIGKRTSISIEYLDSKDMMVPIGSGFLVSKNGKTYGVTNYHVIKGYQSDLYFMGINQDVKKVYNTFRIVAIDSINDIAILKIDKFSISLISAKVVNKVDTTLEHPLALTTGLFATNEKIIEGMELLIMGYPLAIGASDYGNEPVSRRGMVAQKPNRKTNTFIIDGIASHGNSGSPVYDIQRASLLGMIKAFKNETIDAYDSLGNPIIVYDRQHNKQPLIYNSSLAVCITAETILKLIPDK